jgi:O-antigen ligase
LAGGEAARSGFLGRCLAAHRQTVTGAPVSTRVLRGSPAAPAAIGPAAVALGAGTAVLAAAAALSIGPAALGIPLLLAGVLFLVRQPLALLTLFVWVGLFKEQAVVRAFPVDVTLAAGLLLIAVCFHRWLAGRARQIPFGLAAPLAVIGIALVASLAWTPSPAYGAEKAWKFVTLTTLAALAPLFIVEEERDLRRYFSWTVAMAALVAVVTLAGPRASDGRLTIGIEGNTIGIGHLLCTGAIILLLGALTDLLPARLWALAGSVALVGVAAGVGSRGPLLSFVVALAATGVIWLARVPRKTLPVLLVVVAGAALLPFVSLPESSGQRLGAAVSDPVRALEADPRYTSFGQAVGIIEQHPLVGIGTGGFQSVGVLESPPEDYPHNMVLELWAECGLAVLIVVLASIVVLLMGLWTEAWRLPASSPGCRLLYLLIGVFMFNLFEAMLTGDLNENRTFWGVFGLAWLVVRYGVPAPGSDRRLAR